MKYLKRFVILIQFMTTIPIRRDFGATDEDYGKGLATAPAVGLIIGVILAASGLIFRMLFPAVVTAVLVFAVYLILTGGLHMDGLGDTFDGIFSNASKERILEIMRDSRVGTNGLLAVVILILLNIALLASMASLETGSLLLESRSFLKVLLLFPVAGRIGSLTAASVSVYARQGEGLGKSFIDYCGKKELIAGLILYFAIFFAAGGLNWLLASVLPPVTAFAAVKLLGRRIGGATGDILGAVCEINQTLFLLEMQLILG